MPEIKKYIIDIEEKKTPTVHKDLIKKKEISEYNSINDFVYQKMTYGGMLNKEAYLTDKDLKILKKLIQDEQEKRKKK